ncbi:MAG: aldehyde dehydrogenase family protein [Planctomycetia bacterium TMED53]|nr:MAG: aldehyde dehydrogenase family protein [Planctomycetia bacterium TMED53]
MDRSFLESLSIDSAQSGVFSDRWLPGGGAELRCDSPIDGSVLGQVKCGNLEDYEQVVASTHAAFLEWRNWPAPQRGEVVRRIGEALREYKEPLGRLVTAEMGKILPEGLGEVQEMIDIADFSVGLSRQLYGLSMHSERPGHRMYEQWHPLGVVGCITAFNFPVAVWSWNALVAAVCGDAVIWKPSPATALCAVATHRIAQSVLDDMNAPPIFGLIVGDADPVGEAMIADRRLPLISATGSCRMGRRVAEVVGQRLGRSLLELGGNNGIIVTENADLDLVTRAVLFGACGTSGQRCTTTRRLFMHESIADELESRLTAAYQQVTIGNPLDEGVLMGPLINEQAVEGMLSALGQVQDQGGEVILGGSRYSGDAPEGGHYVEPTLVRARHDMPIVHEETFAPVLYLMRYSDLDEVIGWHNEVPQGLSSAIFTRDVQESERFLSAAGSDCGIANVNIGTSGAEIGGAFGGEKDTGGGRESGSDSWKAYMRRQTCTINYSKELPLAQGIQFGS